MSKQLSLSPTAARIVLTMAVAIAVSALAGGCGSKDAGDAGRSTPSGTSAAGAAAQLAQAISLTNARDTPPRDLKVAEGKVVFLRVSSRVAATVQVEGYGVTNQVRAGGSSVLVFSADKVGVFDVRIKGKGVDSVLAQVDVGKK
ncbi:MAG: hypothetical protein HOV67_01365 [Kribbellaceae bacterium]|nr:hypothetical protein [Kribbellaceae bacterium]